MKKNFNLIFLSILAIVLAVSVAIYSTNYNKKTYEVSIYIEGKNANLARVADLLVEYDKNDMELVSTSTGGFLNNSSVISKDGWGVDRALLMSTSVDKEKPILKLKFRSKNRPSNVRLSKQSILYLANMGSVSLPSKDVTYTVKYE